MIPERCTLCKGTLQEGKTEFIARVGDKIVVVRDVPAFICDRCGEAYYSAEISRKLDAVMKDAHSGRLCCGLLRPARLNLPGKVNRQIRRTGRQHLSGRLRQDFFCNNLHYISLSLFDLLLPSGKVAWMTDEKTARIRSGAAMARRDGSP